MRTLSRRYGIAISSICALIMGANVSRAQNLGICGEALVTSTYSKSDARFHDWRLAQKVSREQYEELSNKVVGKAVIYGVPMGANYDEFQKNTNAFAHNSSESITDSEAENILWTGIDPTSANAYSKCIEATSTSGGLSLVVSSATQSDINLTLRWRPRVIGGRPESTTLQLKWSGHTKDSDLPSSVSATDGVAVVIPRPQETATLAVTGSDYLGEKGAWVTITPLPKTPPPPDCPSSLDLTYENVASANAVRVPRAGDDATQYGKDFLADAWEGGNVVPPRGPRSATWEVTIPSDCSYGVRVSYANHSGARSLNLFIDERLLLENIAGQDTGGFDVGHRQLESLGTLRLRAGSHRITLVRTTEDGSWPYFHEMKLENVAQ